MDKNAVLFAHSSGTAYTLTASPALLAFGTRSPQLVITKPGTYRIRVFVNAKFSGATFAANRTLSLVVHENADADAYWDTDIAGSEKTFPTGVQTTYTGQFVQANYEFIHTTTNNDDVLQLRGSLDVLPSAGSVVVTEAYLIAERVDLELEKTTYTFGDSAIDTLRAIEVDDDYIWLGEKIAAGNVLSLHRVSKSDPTQVDTYNLYAANRTAINGIFSDGDYLYVNFAVNAANGAIRKLLRSDPSSYTDYTVTGGHTNESFNLATSQCPATADEYYLWIFSVGSGVNPPYLYRVSKADPSTQSSWAVTGSSGQVQYNGAYDDGTYIWGAGDASHVAKVLKTNPTSQSVYDTSTALPGVTGFWGIMVDDDYAWFGSEGGGILKVDLGTFALSGFKVETFGMWADAFSAILDGDDCLWLFGAANNYIYRVNKNDPANNALFFARYVAGEYGTIGVVPDPDETHLYWVGWGGFSNGNPKILGRLYFDPYSPAVTADGKSAATIAAGDFGSNAIDADSFTSDAAEKLATAVETAILDDDDGKAVKQAFIDKMMAEFPELDELTIAAIAAGVWADASAKQIIADGFNTAMTPSVPPGTYVDGSPAEMLDDVKDAAEAVAGLINEEGTAFTEEALEPLVGAGLTEAQAALIAAIKAKTDLITTGTLNFVGLFDSRNRLTLVRGMDHCVATGYQIDLPDLPGAVLTGAAVVLSVKRKEGSMPLCSVAGSVTGEHAARFEVLSADTENVEASEGDRWDCIYDVWATLESGKTFCVRLNDARILDRVKV